MVPSAARPDLSLSARSVCSLVYRDPRLPAPSTRRDHAGPGSVDLPLCGACGGDWVSGGRWRGRAVHTPACAVPPSPRGVVAGRVGLEGRRWAPGPTRLPVSPVPSVACASLLRAPTSRPLSRRGRVARGACRVLSGVCGCRLVPPFHGSVPTAGGDRGSPPTPPSPSAGLSRVREPRGLASLSGADFLFGGTGGRPRPARRRTLGTRCQAGVFVGWRRRLPRSSLASVGVSSGSRGCPLVSGRLGAAGVAGLLRVGCSVIPAGLARVPGRRPSGLPVPCEASPAGGAAAAGPAVDGPRSAGSLPPPRPPAVLSLSLLVWLTRGRAAGPLLTGGQPGVHGPRGGRGVPGGRGRPAGGRKLRFEGRPGRRGRGGASRLVSWRRVRGESRPARCRGKRLSGCRPRRSVGPVG